MKKLFSLCLALCVVLSSFVVVRADGLQGSGTAEDPYLISTPQELQDAANQSNSTKDFSKDKYYKLTADLDFTNFDYGTNAGFVPFGKASVATFQGTFDGNGHTISNIKISTETDSESTIAGLFAYVMGGTIKNLGIVNAKVDVSTKGEDFGILIGRAKNSVLIENCFVRGWTYENILDCSFGAIVGVIFWGQVTCKNCYVLNNAENENWGTPGYRGDFFADAHANTNSSFTAMNCYATSNEFAAVSDNLAGFTTKIVNCYKNADGVYKYYNNNTAGRYLAESIAPAELKANNRLMGIYVEDTENVNGGFPRLRWEITPGTVAGATEDTPYLIRGYHDFVDFRTYINQGYGENEYFKMTADLDIGKNVTSENKLLEVFVGQSEDAPFKGIFDGDGHVFKNFKMELWGGFTGNFGVFGNLGGNAVVKNTGVEDLTFRLKQQCYQKNGGLIGQVMENATVDQCYARNVTYEELNTEYGENLILGGLIGAVTSENATVRNCYAAKCNVAANVNRDAELIGYVTALATITNCYSDKRLMKIVNELDRTAFTACYAVEKSGDDTGKEWWGDDASFFLPNTTTDKLKTLTESLGGAFVPGGSINNGYPQLAWERGFDVITSAQKSDNQVTVTVKKGNRETGTLYAAAYKGDLMVRAAIGAQKVTASGAYTIDLSVGDGETAKVFLILDDGSQFTPLSMKASID